MPEPPVLAARDQHADLGLAVAEVVGHDLEHGAVDAAVRAVDDVEGDAGEPEPPPLLAERRRPCPGRRRRASARSSSGSSVRAYWSARAVDWSSSSTSTSTEWRRRIGASSAALASWSSSAFSASYWRFSRTSSATITGTSTMMNQAPPANLVTPMTIVTTTGGERTATVDEQAEPPALLLDAEVALGHAGLRQRERGEHADGVERDEVGDVGLEHDDEDRRGARPGR